MLIPPIGVPPLFCNDVNVPHSWTTSLSYADEGLAETMLMTRPRQTKKQPLRNITHLVICWRTRNLPSSLNSTGRDATAEIVYRCKYNLSCCLLVALKGVRTWQASLPVHH